MSLAFEVASHRIPPAKAGAEVPNLISGLVGCCQMFRALALTLPWPTEKHALRPGRNPSRAAGVFPCICFLFG